MWQNTRNIYAKKWRIAHEYMCSKLRTVAFFTLSIQSGTKAPLGSNYAVKTDSLRLR